MHKYAKIKETHNIFCHHRNKDEFIFKLIINGKTVSQSQSTFEQTF